MRGQKKIAKNQALKSGRTIVAERERVESESERMQARRKAHRKHTTSVTIVLLMAAVLALTIYLGGKEMMRQRDIVPSDGGETYEYEIQAEVVDEGVSDVHLSKRMQEFIAILEQDFQDIGYQVSRVTLPIGKGREVYVDLEGLDSYFKVSIDRSTAVSVEDAKRMIKYLEDNDIHPSYVDIRVDGRAYYQ